MVGYLSAASEDLQTSFKHNLTAPTNFTIKLGSSVWNVHADFIASKSDFFKKIIEGSTWKENQERCVEFHDDNPWMVAQMLQFLCYGHYSYDHDARAHKNAVSLAELIRGGGGSSVDTRDGILIDLRMFELGDKSCFETLRSHALDELRDFNEKYFLEMIADYFPDRINHHRDLKKFEAEAIARSYNKLREVQDIEEWNAGVGNWLRDDHELCIMVMDALARSSQE